MHQRHANFIAFVYSITYIVEKNCSRRETTLEDDLEVDLDDFFDEKVMNGNMNISSTHWSH